MDLFGSAKKYADELGQFTTLQRTDLALFDLDAANRTITCNLVEVKCYTSTGGLSGYTQLKVDISHQIHRSEEVLKYHFDPKVNEQDRPDRLLKTLELRTLLEFYLSRANRYQIIKKNSEADKERGICFLFSMKVIPLSSLEVR